MDSRFRGNERAGMLSWYTQARSACWHDAYEWTAAGHRLGSRTADAPRGLATGGRNRGGRRRGGGAGHSPRTRPGHSGAGGALPQRGVGCRAGAGGRVSDRRGRADRRCGDRLGRASRSLGAATADGDGAASRPRGVRFAGHRYRRHPPARGRWCRAAAGAGVWNGHGARGGAGAGGRAHCAGPSHRRRVELRRVCLGGHLCSGKNRTRPSWPRTGPTGRRR